MLPPGLAECYKIMTSDRFEGAPNRGGLKTSTPAVQSAEGHKTDAEVEEEEGLSVSQDEHGNYLVDMELSSPSKGDKKDTPEALPGNLELTPRKKKNVLLPKRYHHHLKENNSSLNDKGMNLEGNNHSKSNVDGKKDENTNPTEAFSSRTCNICGVTFAGKPESWWSTLDSTISGIESVSISMALQVSEFILYRT